MTKQNHKVNSENISCTKESDMAVCGTKASVPRVRFLDEENITERFVSVDEVDAAPKVKKVHILKNRSSSETSILLRASNLSKERVAMRRINGAENDANSKLNLIPENQNNETKENETNVAENRLLPANDKTHESDKDCNLSFKKNCNVYSVHRARTLIAERRKSLPLSTIPKLIGHRVGENCAKQNLIPSDLECLQGSLVLNKDFKARAIGKISRGLGKLLRRTNSVKISEPDPVFKVSYLGNVLTGWARGESCVDKPLTTLWRNYNQTTKPDVVMKLSITNSGLKGFTKEHGLTEYWSHRITYCASPPHYPKIFCWVYRHEGRKLKHELRCHAVLCAKESIAKKIKEELQLKLQQALNEFKKDKISRQNARLSLANSVYENPSMPRRKILLSIGANNYRPPLERSKSAPKLGAIEELCSEEDEEEAGMNNGEHCNTWTKKISEDRRSINIDELYPSYTLGRKRSEKVKSPRKISLPENIPLKFYNNNVVAKTVQGDVQSTDDVLQLLVMESQNMKNEKPNHEVATDKNVAAASTLDVTDKTESVTPTLVSRGRTMEMLAHLCSQDNYIALDSDDGSVSSGCETASTVTSSDNETSSLPCQFTEACNKTPDTKEVKVSVSGRVQNYEQIFSPRHSLQSTQNPIRSSSTSTENGSDSGSDNYDSYEAESKDSNEVNLVPIGEKNNLKRRLTYPPLKNGESVYDFNCECDNMVDNLTDFDSLESNCDNDCPGYGSDQYNQTCDNDSACSDESGYSEFLENGKDGVIRNTVMV